MNADNLFRLVGTDAAPPAEPLPAPPRKRPPWISAGICIGIVLGCLCAGLLAPDGVRLTLHEAGLPPGIGHWFGTDPLGRDLFAMIWHGGRVSLTVGLLAAAIASVLAVLWGAMSGLCGTRLDNLLTRACELFLSIPTILLTVFLQAVWGTATPAGLACVIGATGWMAMAQLVRAEVRRLAATGYVQASRCMNGGFWHVLRWHLLPNFLPALLYLAVSAVGSAIAAEATLSFLGLGLPVEVVSWGSLLAQADRAILSNQWWVVVIPGAFLVALLVSLSELGNRLRRETTRACSNLSPHD